MWVTIPNLISNDQTVWAVGVYVRRAAGAWTPHVRLSWSLEVIGTHTDRSATYDFLLTFHSNHGHISRRFQDILAKIANFLKPRLFNVPHEGYPALGIL